MRADQPHASLFPCGYPVGSGFLRWRVVVVVLACGSLVAWSLEYAVRQRGRCLGGREPRVMIRLSRAASLKGSFESILRIVLCE